MHMDPVAGEMIIPGRKQITRVGLVLLAFLIASFAYELPLFNLTRYYRLNPRFFDIAALLIVLYWLFFGRQRGWRITLSNPVIKPWLLVNGFFAIATVASMMWVPFDYSRYGVFYFLKYLEGLSVLLIVSSIPFDDKTKKRLLWVALLGGLWVSFYAIFQYLGIFSTERYLATGQEMTLYKQGVYSTLGWTYFHVGMFSVLSTMIGLALFNTSGIGKKLIALVMSVMCAVPAVVSGSRAGLIAFVISVMLVITTTQYRKKIGSYFILALLLLVGGTFYYHSATKERLEGGKGGTIVERLMTGPITLLMAVQYNGYKVLAVGGGFYVVPFNSEDGGGFGRGKKPNYRVGYGNHNIFLFPLEQAGLGGFFASLWLWWSIWKSLRVKIKNTIKNTLDNSFATTMQAYFFALMVVGMAGQVFWLGFGTEHSTIYQLLMFVLALSGSTIKVSEKTKRSSSI
jgi:hypothetical protein